MNDEEKLCFVDDEDEPNPELNRITNAIIGIHTSQMISYLSITGHRLGLIINFNVAALRQGIKRIAGRPRLNC